jgi:hypothetical protein
MFLSVKELLDNVTKLRRCSGVMKPQSLWYMAIERERAQHMKCWSHWIFSEGKENPHNCQILKTCAGFKNPLKLYMNVEIVICETLNSLGPSIGGEHVAVGRHFSTRKTKREEPCFRKS